MGREARTEFNELHAGVVFQNPRTKAFLAGARLPFTWIPTDSGSSSTFLSFEPFVRFDVSEAAFLNARFTLNIDEPLGFSFDDGKVWALHLGFGAAI